VPKSNARHLRIARLEERSKFFVVADLQVGCSPPWSKIRCIRVPAFRRFSCEMVSTERMYRPWRERRRRRKKNNTRCEIRVVDVAVDLGGTSGAIGFFRRIGARHAAAHEVIGLSIPERCCQCHNDLAKILPALLTNSMSNPETEREGSPAPTNSAPPACGGPSKRFAAGSGLACGMIEVRIQTRPILSVEGEAIFARKED